MCCPRLSRAGSAARLLPTPRARVRWAGVSLIIGCFRARLRWTALRQAPPPPQAGGASNQGGLRSNVHGFSSGAAAAPAGRALGAQQVQAVQQPAQPRFTGGGQTLGSGGSGQSRLLDDRKAGTGVRPLSAAAGRPLSGGLSLSGAGRPDAAARPDIDPSILAVQMSEIDSMLSAVADAPRDVLEPALELLVKMFTAIIDKPNEPKVRRIRWMNAKVQEHLAGVPIAQDFLVASGFSIIESPVEGSQGETETVLLFEDGSSRTLLSEARGRLNQALARARSSPSSAAGAAVAAAAQPCRELSTNSDLSAGDSPMSPASPARHSAGADERPVSTNSAAEFAAPGASGSAII